MKLGKLPKDTTTKDFKPSMKKNAIDPKVGQKLHMLQIQQQKELIIGVMSS